MNTEVNTITNCMLKINLITLNANLQERLHCFIGLLVVGHAASLGSEGKDLS
jgi:hypothetical protein